MLTKSDSEMNNSEVKKTIARCMTARSERAPAR